MNASTPRPPFAGKTFEVRYDGLTALNAYDDDGRHMRYEITEGPYAGAKGEIEYTWQPIAGDTYAISWQEADRATVVHIDDSPARRGPFSPRRRSISTGSKAACARSERARPCPLHSPHSTTRRRLQHRHRTAARQRLVAGRQREAPARPSLPGVPTSHATQPSRNRPTRSASARSGARRTGVRSRVRRRRAGVRNLRISATSPASRTTSCSARRPSCAARAAAHAEIGRVDPGTERRPPAARRRQRRPACRISAVRPRLRITRREFPRPDRAAATARARASRPVSTCCPPPVRRCAPSRVSRSKRPRGSANTWTVACVSRHAGRPPAARRELARGGRRQAVRELPPPRPRGRSARAAAASPRRPRRASRAHRELAAMRDGCAAHRPAFPPQPAPARRDDGRDRGRGAADVPRG